MPAGNYVIVAHGGAGEVRSEKAEIVEKGVRKAVIAGSSILKSRGSALDAVEECVKMMEDDPNFNAGTGSALTMKGTVEMDASISDGRTLDSGAVGLISNVRYPVSLARLIMEKTDHVLIIGASAEKIAEESGLELRDPRTPERLKMWKESRKKFERGEIKYLPKTIDLIRRFPDLVETVGAVAIDSNGDLAAATSTGGLMLKLPGRIGDTPVIGAGNYADNEAGAVSCTGIGEAAVRLCLARIGCEYMREGLTAYGAAKRCIELVNKRQRGLDMGVITVDRTYNYGLDHNSKNLVWALQTKETSGPRSGLRYPT
nr:isoaspartyl peptidase/L-asparaginase [Candidatus Njordarchaeota archaeon]